MHPSEATTRTVVPVKAAAPPAAIAAPPGAPRLRYVSAAIVTTLVGLTALAAWRLSFVDGLLRRVTIDGPSMAPALVGPHYAVTCGDCRFPFTCDAEHPPANERAVCPNCGYSKNDLKRAAVQPAERVLIDRWPLSWRGARRGEIVAARIAGQNAALLQPELVVKRVGGLPGERWGIRDGDLYADEQIVRKKPTELRAVRVLVHDNDYRPRQTAGLPPRWQGAAASTWRPTLDGFAHAEEVPASGDADWLVYQHWPGTGNPLVQRTQPSPIYDLDSFNQEDTKRALARVHDVQLTCRLYAVGTGTLQLVAIGSGLRLEVRIEPRERRLTALVDGRIEIERELPHEFLEQGPEIMFGLCDRQLLLVMDGRTLVSLPYRHAASTSTKDPSPLQIGVRGLSVKVSQLRVWRDVYYLPPSTLAEPWRAPIALGPGELALLGDNPPVSRDSRQWQPAGVPTAVLLGRVCRPFWSRR